MTSIQNAFILLFTVFITIYSVTAFIQQETLKLMHWHNICKRYPKIYPDLVGVKLIFVPMFASSKNGLLMMQYKCNKINKNA